MREAVLDHQPCDVGLVGQLWTRRLVGDLIAKLYRVRLIETGVGKYLKRWGLSFQRPGKSPGPKWLPRSRTLCTLRQGRNWRYGSAGRPVSHDADLYKERNTVERLINKLKAWRGDSIRALARGGAPS